METSQEQIPENCKPSANFIDRHKNLTQKELLHEYVIPRKPVILTEAALQWKAIKRWTPEFFKSEYGHIRRQIKGKEYSIAQQIDLMFNSTEDNPAPYPFNFDMQVYFPELLKDLTPALLYGESDRISNSLLPKALLKRTHPHELFFGGRGGSFPLHYDELFLHTQITQIYGEKEFFLYPPEQSDLLYPEESNPKISKLKNIFNPDIEKYPLFKKATPFVEMLKKGETILFPSMWWHTTRIPNPSISYGRAILNAYNWNYFLNDYFNSQKKNLSPKVHLLYNYSKAIGVIMKLQEKLKS